MRLDKAFMFIMMDYEAAAIFIDCGSCFSYSARGMAANGLSCLAEYEHLLFPSALTLQTTAGNKKRGEDNINNWH